MDNVARIVGITVISALAYLLITLVPSIVAADDDDDVMIGAWIIGLVAFVFLAYIWASGTKCPL